MRLITSSASRSTTAGSNIVAAAGTAVRMFWAVLPAFLSATESATSPVSGSVLPRWEVSARLRQSNVAGDTVALGISVLASRAALGLDGLVITGWALEAMVCVSSGTLTPARRKSAGARRYPADARESDGLGRKETWLADL